MLQFYCTRCGSQLQIAEEHAGRRVKCAHCKAVVPSPQPGNEVPHAVVAEVEEATADTDEVLEELEAEVVEAAMRGMAKPVPGTPLWQVELDTDAVVEKLEQVEVPADAENVSMTECPHCGSTIASYVGRCPFCRILLRGS
jgi:DNA-directed RNA polymerase subunit M/transcription elongation factor TFIIS